MSLLPFLLDVCIVFSTVVTGLGLELGSTGQFHLQRTIMWYALQMPENASVQRLVSTKYT